MKNKKGVNDLGEGSWPHFIPWPHFKPSRERLGYGNRHPDNVSVYRFP